MTQSTVLHGLNLYKWVSSQDITVDTLKTLVRCVLDRKNLNCSTACTTFFIHRVLNITLTFYRYLQPVYMTIHIGLARKAFLFSLSRDVRLFFIVNEIHKSFMHQITYNYTLFFTLFNLFF
jgi:hypothetical protein